MSKKKRTLDDRKLLQAVEHKIIEVTQNKVWSSGVLADAVVELIKDYLDGKKRKAKKSWGHFKVDLPD